MGTGDVVQILAGRLRQLDAADLPSGEKARLTATVADSLIRAISVYARDHMPVREHHHDCGHDHSHDQHGHGHGHHDHKHHDH